jgi:hypothetical protein
VLNQVLETSTNKHVNQRLDTINADLDPKRKRNNRVNSFVWTSSMSVHNSNVNHLKTSSIVGPLATQSNELQTLSEMETTPVTRKRTDKENALMTQTQNLY